MGPDPAAHWWYCSCAGPGPVPSNVGLTAKYSGWNVTDCAVALDDNLGDRVWREWGDCGGGGKEVERGDGCVYVPDEGFGGGRTGMAATTGGWIVSGVCAFERSSFQSLDKVTAAASAGEAYRAEELSDGGRGRGACRRGSGA
jgi:hypothetical protein